MTDLQLSAYREGYEAGYAAAKQEHAEWLAAAAKKAMHVPENAPGSFVPCERWDFRGNYCIEGKECTCVGNLLEEPQPRGIPTTQYPNQCGNRAAHYAHDDCPGRSFDQT